MPNSSESEILVPTAPKRLFSEEPVNYRNLIKVQSSDSQNGSGSDWIGPSAESWKGFPRPASRNVMQIDHGSGMVAVLPESSSSPSSDDNQKPSSARGNVNVKQIQVLPVSDRVSSSSRPVISTRPSTNDTSSDDYISTASPPKRDVSPAILTNTIKTGSEFRCEQFFIWSF